jgi:hypothetical protein
MNYMNSQPFFINMDIILQNFQECLNNALMEPTDGW